MGSLGEAERRPFVLKLCRDTHAWAWQLPTDLPNVDSSALCKSFRS